jgi:predicted O-methyltransferase YrrM
MNILTHEFIRACARPLDAWNSLRHWTLLAHAAQLPYADVMRARLELRDNIKFQEHLKRCLGEIQYAFQEAAELYVVVRAAKPKVVVETGVASGISSAHILLALAANRAGTLHSIDLPNVQQGSVLPQGRTSGWIVPDSLRYRWMLHVGHSWELLPDLLKTLDQIDLFLHDSDHSYESMSFEFEQAFPRLRPGGLIMGDDTHLHSAWDDFCAKHKLRPTRLGRLGVTRKR